MGEMSGLVCILLLGGLIGALASSNMDAGEAHEVKGHYLRGTKPEMVEGKKFKSCAPKPVDYPPPYVYPSPDYSPPDYSPSPDYSPDYKSPSPDYKSPSPDYKSPSPDYKSPSPDYKSPSPDYKSPSPDYKSPSPDYMSPSPDYKSPLPSPPYKSAGSYASPAPPYGRK